MSGKFKWCFRKFPKSFKEVSRKFQECFKKVFTILQGRLEGGVLSGFQEYLKEVKWVFQGSLQGVSKMFQGSFKGVSREIEGCSESPQGI